MMHNKIDQSRRQSSIDGGSDGGVHKWMGDVKCPHGRDFA
jgi:hypothetical protein